MKSIERKPRRIVLAIISIVVIAIMWIKKDVLGLWSGISSEDILPLLMTNGLVMLAKIAVLAVGIYLIKIAAAKIKNRNK
ncbi:MAG: hypothetical protein IKL57_06845 [Oscillospiraceae bacterium]|nr:hypothetical protein [Oscillospiraceae bacterium]